MRRRRILPAAGDEAKLAEMIGAVIYVRVSTKEQTENLSLPTQLRACEEYCKGQGYDVLERFHEEGESAKTTDRSQLQALLKYCRTHKGKVHFVVVYNLTRFAREKYDHFALRAHLKSLGISLRSATEPIDDTSTGKLMEGVLAAFAQFDNDVRSDRTRAGMRAALELGRWTFPAPLGYLVRIALGAGRGRIVQQLVAEHLLMSAVAAVLGVALGVWALRAVAPLLPIEEVFQAFSAELPVLAFAILFAVLTAVLVGVAPARQALAVDPLPALKGAESGRRQMPAARLRHALVSFQVALSLILIACSAVLARGIVRALRVDPGFPLQGLYAVMLESSVSEPRAQLLLQRVRETLRGTPGVGNVGLISIPPFHGAGFSSARTDLMASPVPVNFSMVDMDYFRTLGVAPNAGRSFDAGEAEVSALVNSSFARKFWGDEREAIGRSIEIPDRRDEQASERVTIVGVVPTIQSVDVGVPDGATFYLMSGATRNGRLSLVVRAEPHVPILRIVADAARSLDADAVATVVSIQERIAARTMPARVSAMVAAALGLLAVLVALVGIHGIVAHAVSSRTREIGVHVALGASRARILQLIMGDTLRSVLKGGIAGGLVVLVGAYALSAVLRPLTFGVAALDPIALLATALLLSVLTFPAAYLPARRALGIAPIEALRQTRSRS
jgi:putative ABC transport system permease protein